jgi:hypothetical protein
VRLLDQSRDLADHPPRVRGDRSPGGALSTAAGVGAAVEPAAGCALVDLPGAERHRAAQPIGVAAGVLALVGVRRAVDAAVRHPPGRHPDASAPPEVRPALTSGGRVAQHPPEVDVVVELLELSVACRRDRLLERVAEGARRANISIRAVVISFPFAGITPIAAGAIALAATRSRSWLLRLADDLPVRARRAVEPLEVAVGDPDHARVELVQRGEIVGPEHALPHAAHRDEDAGV